MSHVFFNDVLPLVVLEPRMKLRTAVIGSTPPTAAKATLTQVASGDLTLTVFNLSSELLLQQTITTESFSSVRQSLRVDFSAFPLALSALMSSSKDNPAFQAVLSRPASSELAHTFEITQATNAGMDTLIQLKLTNAVPDVVLATLSARARDAELAAAARSCMDATMKYNGLANEVAALRREMVAIRRERVADGLHKANSAGAQACVDDDLRRTRSMLDEVPGQRLQIPDTRFQISPVAPTRSMPSPNPPQSLQATGASPGVVEKQVPDTPQHVEETFLDEGGVKDDGVNKGERTVTETLGIPVLTPAPRTLQISDTCFQISPTRIMPSPSPPQTLQAKGASPGAVEKQVQDIPQHVEETFLEEGDVSDDAVNKKERTITEALGIPVLTPLPRMQISPLPAEENEIAGDNSQNEVHMTVRRASEGSYAKLLGIPDLQPISRPQKPVQDGLAKPSNGVERSCISRVKRNRVTEESTGTNAQGHRYEGEKGAPMVDVINLVSDDEDEAQPASVSSAENGARRRPISQAPQAKRVRFAVSPLSWKRSARMSLGPRRPRQLVL